MKNRPTRSTFQQRLNTFVNTIRSDAQAGALLPGTYLPSEIELAVQYQLSKLSIRKGLKQLEQEGLIEKIPKVGTRIASLEVKERQVVKFALHESLIHEAAIEPLIKQFEAQNPDIEIQFHPFPYQQFLDNIDYHVDNELVDIISVNYDQLQEFADTSRLSMFVQQQMDFSAYPYVQNGFIYDDQLYARPFIFSPVVLCYNENHFDEMQLQRPQMNWTWQDLFETACKLSNEQERYGFYFHLLSQNRWPIFLLQNGYHFDQDQAPDEIELFLSSMTLCKDLIIGQRVSSLLIDDNDLFAEELFKNEKASIIMTTYFNLNYLLETGIPFKLAPLPSMKEPSTLLLSIGLCVLNASPRREAAQRFVEFLTSYESQLFIRRHTMSIPTNRLAAEQAVDYSVYHPPEFHLYRDITDSYRYYTELGINSQQLTSLRKELNYYWSGLSDNKKLLEVVRNIWA